MTKELNDFLADRSSLTKRQIECLSLYTTAQRSVRRGANDERPYAIAGVSEGAYYRVVGQAKNNVNQAIYTILLSTRMGIIDATDVQRLLNLVGRIPQETSDSSNEVISLIEALVSKIVML